MRINVNDPSLDRISHSSRCPQYMALAPYGGKGHSGAHSLHQHLTAMGGHMVLY